MGLFSKIKEKFESLRKQDDVKPEIVEQPVVEKETKPIIESKPKPVKQAKPQKTAPAKKTVKEEVKELDTYEKGLSKTTLSKEIEKITETNRVVDDNYFEALEETLIMADIGVNTVMELVDSIKKRAKKEKINDSALLKEMIVDELFIIYVNDEIIVNKINISSEKPTVILFIGVNGVGKTTSIAKIAHRLNKEKAKILFIAGDTFRAGANEQLEVWAQRANTDIIKGKDNSDPSSVIYDGLVKAKSENYDYVLIDTAGRLQNKANLMNELDKINRTINKLIPGAPHETLLVIDATTGQNGINQAKAFKEITNITGIILSKLDGTAKGGIVLAIKEAVNIPVKFVGLGETMEDLQVFDLEKYMYGLFKDF